MVIISTSATEVSIHAVSPELGVQFSKTANFGSALAAQAGISSGQLGTGPGEMMGNAGPGMLSGLRVVEIADERAEYVGLLLSGLGAEVIKIEPPEGNATRRIGPSGLSETAY